MAHLLYGPEDMEHKHSGTAKHSHYGNLGIMAALSFIAMFALMYAMVHRYADVLVNVNQLYMAGLMTTPMVLIELIVMRTMYKNRRLNLIIMTAAVLAGIAMFAGIQTQAAVSNTQFLRSMIPHHSSAILMCERASITDPDIQQLCKGIISSQSQEIDQMNRLLGRRP